MRSSMVPREPIRLDRVFDRDDVLSELVRTHGPYEQLQRRIMRSPAEEAAMRTGTVPEADDAARDGGTTLRLLPSFRQYWALREPLVDGVDRVFRWEPFIAAARQLFGARYVRPLEVYVNIGLPRGRTEGAPHSDIPVFRGIGRRDYPVWLPVTMRRSGLFERWRTCIATAVTWYYEGDGGTYSYWDRGVDTPPSTTPKPITNTAMVGENDTMFHRADSFGPEDAVPVTGLTLESALECDPENSERWRVVDGERVLTNRPEAELRMVLSWSAEAFRDEEEMRSYDEHLDDLDIETVMATFLADLRKRGSDVDIPADPLTDERFIATLAREYRLSPVGA